MKRIESGIYRNSNGDTITDLSQFSGTEYTQKTKWQIEFENGDILREKSLKESKELVKYWSA